MFLKNIIPWIIVIINLIVPLFIIYGCNSPITPITISHFRKEVHFNKPGDKFTVEGLTVELVSFDPRQGIASIRASPGPNNIETAKEGDFFGNSRSISLQKVSPDGVDIVVRGVLLNDN